MSKKLYLKKNVLKVLANGTRPYYCDTCPCQQPIFTGHYFVDYIEYNLPNRVNIDAYNWGDDQQILETSRYSNVLAVDSNWRASAICVPQNRFYNSYIYPYNEQGVRNSLINYTKQLVETQNNYRFDVTLCKENKWWNCQFSINGANGLVSMVSGNTTSAVIDNFNLSTMVTTLQIRKTQPSGLISSFVVNNVDNEFRNGNFITVDNLYKYALTSSTDNKPIISTAMEEENYLPVQNKTEAVVQYYLTRIYEGDQLGYIFNSIKPTSWKTGHSYKVLNNFTLAGRDNAPSSGKTYYFYNVGYNTSDEEDIWRQVRKQGTKYYGYSLDDNKTIVEYPATGITSARLVTDSGRQIVVGEKVTDGIIASYGRYDDHNILSTNNGVLDDDGYTFYYWLNYPTRSPQYVRISGQSGQYFITDYYETEYIEDSEDYFSWWYRVVFIKDYSTATYTATANVYQIGWFNDEDPIISEAIPSTTVFSARMADYEYYQSMNIPQPPVHWDSTNKEFFYYEGGETPEEGEVHADFRNLAFELPGHDSNGNVTGTVKYYVYKAPQWGVYTSLGKNMYWGNYIVTGNSWNTIRCWNEINQSNNEQPNIEMTISAGYYTNNGYPDTQSFYTIHSGANYWYVLSGNGSDVQIPLTGGDYRYPQKSTAVENQNRPPYWYFNSSYDGRQVSRKWGWFSTILSGKYIYIPENYTIPNVKNVNNRIGIVVPIYYDTYYGNAIKNNSYEPGTDTQVYKRCKEMINSNSYSFASPFVKYIETKYNYYVDDGSVQLGDVIDDQYLIPSNPSTIEATDYLYQQNGFDYVATWGGTPDGDTYTTRTQKFLKMTQQQINSIIWTGDAWKVSTDYAGNYLASMNGLYCQILTGFWIRNYADRGAGARAAGIRKHGYFFQTLNFNTEYKFGYDLSNLDQLNALLSADTSLCYTYSGANLVKVQVKDYWAAMSGGLQSTTAINNTSLGYMNTGSQIKVISGVFSI